MSDILKYENVVGSPMNVQYRVEKLIKEGWKLNGEFLPFLPEGRQTGLFVQSMVLKKEKQKC